MLIIIVIVVINAIVAQVNSNEDAQSNTDSEEIYNNGNENTYNYGNEGNSSNEDTNTYVDRGNYSNEDTYNDVDEDNYSDIKIPHWDSIIKGVKEAASSFSHCRYTSWDVAATETGFEFIEGNVHSDPILLQLFVGPMLKNLNGNASREILSPPLDEPLFLIPGAIACSLHHNSFLIIRHNFWGQRKSVFQILKE